jgi:hypothetical protein
MGARLAAVVLAAASAVGGGAAAQPQGGPFHDCIRITRATWSITADADGAAMRLNKDNSARFYPGRAARMDKSAEVFLQCTALTDRPAHCAVVRETTPGFSFGDAAIRVAESGRLTSPAGVWPVDIVVAFRYRPLAHPIFDGYC